MEFHEKLQELRKKKGLTQEELAQELFVSRTAVSKWESGRGYPNIDSLKAISRFYAVTIDDLLSGEELLTLAEDDGRQKEKHVCDLVLGLLDCTAALFLFLPLFGQRAGESVREVSLLGLDAIAAWVRAVYVAVVLGMVALGVATLALQNCQNHNWNRYKSGISLGLNAVGVLVFILGQQVYAAAFLFVFLTIKAVILGKRR